MIYTILFELRAASNYPHNAIEMATEFINAVGVRPWFLLYHQIHPSVSVGFLGWRVRMSVIWTAENPKIGNIGAKIRASIYKKPQSPYFLKKCYEFKPQTT